MALMIGNDRDKKRVVQVSEVWKKLLCMEIPREIR